MDVRAAVLACIDRIPDTEEGNAALRKMYAIGKRAGKEKRLRPAERPEKDDAQDWCPMLIRDRLHR